MNFKKQVMIFLNENKLSPYSEENIEIKGNRMLFSDMDKHRKYSKYQSEITVFMEFFRNEKPISPSQLEVNPKWLARTIGRSFNYRTRKIADNINLPGTLNRYKVANQTWTMRTNKKDTETEYYLKSEQGDYEIRICTERVQGIPLRANRKTENKFDDFDD